MAFGLSFGAKKTNSKSTTDVDSLVTQNQSTTGTNTSSGTTTNTGTTTQTGSTSGTSNQATSQQQQQTGSTSGTGTQRTSLFSDDILGDIQGAVKNLFGTLDGANRVDSSALQKFDPLAFVSEGMRAAQATQRSGLDEAMGGVKDSIGGSANTNSAVALLQNRLNSDAAANLAGVHANLSGQAQGIQRENLLASSSINGTQNQFLSTLLEVLKGGSATTQTAEQQQQASAGTSSGTSVGSTTELSQQTQQSQQIQTQQLIEQLSQLIAGTTHTKGTESTKSSGTSFGGGVSVGM